MVVQETMQNISVVIQKCKELHVYLNLMSFQIHAMFTLQDCSPGFPLTVFGDRPQSTPSQRQIVIRLVLKNTRSLPMCKLFKSAIQELADGLQMPENDQSG